MLKSQDFMAMALKEAEKAFTQHEVPVGAVLVIDQKCIARGHNSMRQNQDPTCHAEMVVLRQAMHLLGQNHLYDASLYVTLEPCAMCAGALSLARIKTLVFGAYDPKGGAIVHGPCFFHQPTCMHRPEVIGGVQERACGTLLTTFFQDKRGFF